MAKFLGLLGLVLITWGVWGLFGSVGLYFCVLFIGIVLVGAVASEVPHD